MLRENKIGCSMAELDTFNPKQVAVVIPHYREMLNEDERQSLNQCAEVLGRYALFMVLPEDIEGNSITDLFAQKKVSIDRKCFPKEYFDGIRGYNQLMLSKQFYQAFVDYDYILIYQTDAFVFRDELTEWCERGYDYIGAPWFQSYWLWRSNTKLWTSGNGGLSLRNVASFLKVLNHKGPFKPLRSFLNINNSPLLKIKKLPFNRLVNITIENTVEFFTSINQTTEDRFWGVDTMESYLDFNVAPNEVAMRFSFECNPRHLYKLTNQQLPFGCHAWRKYDKDFWDEVYFNLHKSELTSDK